MTSPSWPAVMSRLPLADRSKAVSSSRCELVIRPIVVGPATSTMSTSRAHRTARRVPRPSKRSPRQWLPRGRLAISVHGLESAPGRQNRRVVFTSAMSVTRAASGRAGGASRQPLARTVTIAQIARHT
ncbi:MAG: hypothetical protein DME01_19950 [Candidatus Rokuibacteriota bacterium]|nr:MAG: hypothetical protein DME01_19950 [Candidatus Rokubacteria bacterium]